MRENYKIDPTDPDYIEDLFTENDLDELRDAADQEDFWDICRTMALHKLLGTFVPADKVAGLLADCDKAGEYWGNEVMDRIRKEEDEAAG